MKIKFFCDSGANIHSCREQILDLEDLGISEDEWNDMSEDDKYKEAEMWANERLEIGFEELED